MGSSFRPVVALLLVTALAGAAEGVIKFLLVTESAQQELNARCR